MAHYALVDENNIVVKVIAGVDENAVVNGITDWEQFYSEKTGYTAVRTSYNTSRGVHKTGGTPFRGNYAGIGYTYNKTEFDAFIPPKPYPSWVLNTETFCWDAPVPYPQDGNEYVWDEASVSWTLYVGDA